MNDLAIYEQMAQKIIANQEQVIGPMAWTEANKIKSITVKEKKVEITESDKKMAVDNLVAQFETLFGEVSVEFCKEAVRSMIRDMNEADVPSKLK